jgi:hypothetical protein
VCLSFLSLSVEPVSSDTEAIHWLVTAYKSQKASDQWWPHLGDVSLSTHLLNVYHGSGVIKS